MNNYCVYLHRNARTNEIFYVGSGREKRANEKAQRGPNWNLIVETDGFVSEIVLSQLSKEESLQEEYDLYFFYKNIVNLANHHAPKLIKKFPIEDIKKDLYYDETSPTFLRWKTSLAPSSNGRFHNTGDIAGNVKGKSKKVFVGGQSCSVHKVIWLLFNEKIEPGYVIDHIDGDDSNNRISNLRHITQAENSRNKKNLGKNKYGVDGVVLFKRLNRTDQWRAQYNELNGKLVQKYFSILKLGYEEAFRQACQWRASQIGNLNLQGAGYTTRHGT